MGSLFSKPKTKQVIVHFNGKKQRVVFSPEDYNADNKIPLQKFRTKLAKALNVPATSLKLFTIKPPQKPIDNMSATLESYGIKGGSEIFAVQEADQQATQSVSASDSIAKIMNSLESELGERIHAFVAQPPTDPSLREQEHRILSESVLARLISLDNIEITTPEERTERKEAIAKLHKYHQDVDASLNAAEAPEETPVEQPKEKSEVEPTKPTSEAPKVESKSEPKFEAPKVETPKAEVPRVETPKAETPKVEPKPEPKIETPKAEVPKVETPKAEAPKVETPKAEAPKVETPKAEVPKAETPKVESKPEPKIETPKVEAPKVETPKVESKPEPKIETPKVETPKVESKPEPKIETPKVETPKVESKPEPKIESKPEPKIETPKVETPKVESKPEPKETKEYTPKTNPIETPINAALGQQETVAVVPPQLKIEEVDATEKSRETQPATEAVIEAVETANPNLMDSKTTETPAAAKEAKEDLEEASGKESKEVSVEPESGKESTEEPEEGAAKPALSKSAKKNAKRNAKKKKRR